MAIYTIYVAEISKPHLIRKSDPIGDGGGFVLEKGLIQQIFHESFTQL
ncbi:MAG: hypothetical protein AB8B99_13155 [Phormidesmis sp.]